MKLTTRHCAFLKIQNDVAKIHYSTQNTRFQLEIEKQKVKIDNKFIAIFNKIESSYPAYVDINDLYGDLRSQFRMREVREFLLSLAND